MCAEAAATGTSSFPTPSASGVVHTTAITVSTFCTTNPQNTCACLPVMASPSDTPKICPAARQLRRLCDAPVGRAVAKERMLRMGAEELSSMSRSRLESSAPRVEGKPPRERTMSAHKA